MELQSLRRPWLFWILQKPNLIIALLYIERKQNWSHVFASSLMASNTKRANLTWLPLDIMHRGHTWHDYPWPWVSLTWLLYNLQLWRHRRWFRKFTVRFRPIRKELESSMYNNMQCLSGSQYIIYNVWMQETTQRIIKLFDLLLRQEGKIYISTTRASLLQGQYLIKENSYISY